MKRLAVSHAAIYAGEALPPWYYGFTYEEPNEARTVFHPVPINYAMRWARSARNTWDRFRSRRPKRARLTWYRVECSLDGTLVVSARFLIANTEERTVLEEQFKTWVRSL